MPDPQAREIARITWDRASIPQNAIPFTSHGKPYVLEFDEYNASTLANGDPNDVGAGRIIDISDERAPRIVSNLRLEVNQPPQHEEASGDRRQKHGDRNAKQQVERTGSVAFGDSHASADAKTQPSVGVRASIRAAAKPIPSALPQPVTSAVRLVKSNGFTRRSVRGRLAAKALEWRRSFSADARHR